MGFCHAIEQAQRRAHGVACRHALLHALHHLGPLLAPLLRHLGQLLDLLTPWSRILLLRHRRLLVGCAPMAWALFYLRGKTGVCHAPGP